jgi:hypothetical protein
MAVKGIFWMSWWYPDIGWEVISDSKKVDLIMIASFMAINGPRGLGVQVKVPRISIKIKKNNQQKKLCPSVNMVFY